MDVFGKDFRDFINCLNAQGVEYMMVGGYSVIVYGYNRTTGDMDIWVNPTKENYQNLVKAFECFGMPVFDMVLSAFLGRKSVDVFTFGTPPVAIDIMTSVKGLEFDDAFRNSVMHEIGNVTVRTIHLKDLVKAKKASNRPKDQDDIEHLTS